jgi:hypothetical protein
MTFREAKQLVQERAGSKYTGTPLRLLERMTGALYNKTNPEADVTNVRVERTRNQLCLWARVEKKQLARALALLKDEVQTISNRNGKVTFTLNLESMKELPKTAQVARNKVKQQKADRAAKARAQRSNNQKANRVSDAAQVMRELQPRFFMSILHPSRAAVAAAAGA